MSQITVHPEALKSAMIAYDVFGNDMDDAVEAALQWYIDHPQITSEQFIQLYKRRESVTQTSEFIRELLTIALSGKPEVPRDLKPLLADEFDATSVSLPPHIYNKRIVEAYNLGKGAK